MSTEPIAAGPNDVTVMQQQVQRDIDRLNKERQVTTEMMNTPMDAPILAMRRSEWLALTPEAQAKLMQITGAIHPDELRRRAQAAEDLRLVPLVHNAIAHRTVEAEGRNGSGGATGCAAGGED